MRGEGGMSRMNLKNFNQHFCISTDKKVEVELKERGREREREGERGREGSGEANLNCIAQMFATKQLIKST